MFDIAWSEMLVILVVALVVVGPKDLPRLVREIGRWTGRAQRMGREFRRTFDDMVREAELDDIRKGIDAARPSNLSQTIREAIDPEGDLDEAFHLDNERLSATAAAPTGPMGPPVPPAGQATPAAAAPETAGIVAPRIEAEQAAIHAAALDAPPAMVARPAEELPDIADTKVGGALKSMPMAVPQVSEPDPVQR